MKAGATREPQTSRRLRFISNSSPTQTTGRLFRTLADRAQSPTTSTEIEYRQLPRGIWPKVLELRRSEISNLRRLRQCDALVLHTPLALSIVSILTARILRKKVVVYVWDMHPESTRIIGSLRNPWILGIYWLVERLALQLSSQIVIASTDYLPAVRPWRRKVRVVPLWPSDEQTAKAHPLRRDPEVLTVGFAGQINAIRGLESGINELMQFWQGRKVQLRIFSKDDVSNSLLEIAHGDARLDLQLRGELKAQELQIELSSLDAGWVCLDPGFSLPAFPSKSMTYLSAGVPILYTGPRLAGYEEWLTINGFGVVTRDTSLTPEALTSITTDLRNRRDAYFASMHDQWFAL